MNNKIKAKGRDSFICGLPCQFGMPKVNSMLGFQNDWSSSVASISTRSLALSIIGIQITIHNLLDPKSIKMYVFVVYVYLK